MYRIYAHQAQKLVVVVAENGVFDLRHAAGHYDIGFQRLSSRLPTSSVHDYWRTTGQRITIVALMTAAFQTLQQTRRREVTLGNLGRILVA